MKKIKIVIYTFILATLALFLFYSQLFIDASTSLKSSKNSNRIIVYVNQKFITSNDVRHRMYALSHLLGIENNEKNRQKLFKYAINQLIEEIVKVHIPHKQNLQMEITQEMMVGFGNLVAQTMEIDYNTVIKLLSDSTIKKEWYKMVSAEIHHRAIFNYMMSNRTVDKKGVQLVLEQIYANDGPEAALKIIRIPVTGKDKEKSALEHAEKLYSDIQKGRVTFDAAAKEHSRHISSHNGGIIGWSRINSLNDEMKTTILNLDSGEVSKPFFVKEDFAYFIIKLLHTRNWQQFVSKEYNLVYVKLPFNTEEDRIKILATLQKSLKSTTDLCSKNKRYLLRATKNTEILPLRGVALKSLNSKWQQHILDAEKNNKPITIFSGDKSEPNALVAIVLCGIEFKSEEEDLKKLLIREITTQNQESSLKEFKKKQRKNSIIRFVN